ncbi:MAG: hypothetical protein AAF653_21800, partial [Chloroflexota bacterium]
MAVIDDAVEAKRQKTNEFLAKRNVVGMGVGYKNALGEESGQESVVVLVQTKKPEDALTEDDLIPPEIDGIPTDVVEIGILRANQAVNNPRTRQRPVVFAGASMAHYMVGAGTLGIVVRHRTSGERLLLSNNHVLANSNDANIGDAILQPGALDGGSRSTDIVAQLVDFRRLAYIEEAGQAQPAPQPPPTMPEQPTTPGQPSTPTQPPSSGTESGCDVVEAVVALANLLASASGSSKRVTSQSVTAQGVPITAQSTGATPAEVPMIPSASLDNLLDAALARPTNPAMFSDEVMQIGRINGSKEPTLGMTIAKFGRTTGYTTGRVTLLNATVNVQYDTIRGTRTARFVEQVITSGMSSSG